MHYCVFCVLISLLLSCSNQGNYDSFDKQKTVQEITQTFISYHQDIKTKGMTAEFAYLDSSADFFWVPPGYSNSLSYDSVAKVLRQNAPLFVSIDNSFDTLRIIPLNSEMATYTGKVHSTMTDTSGHVTTVELIETGTVIKRKDGWKLLNGQTAVIDHL